MTLSRRSSSWLFHKGRGAKSDSRARQWPHTTPAREKEPDQFQPQYRDHQTRPKGSPRSSQEVRKARKRSSKLYIHKTSQKNVIKKPDDVKSF